MLKKQVYLDHLDIGEKNNQDFYMEQYGYKIPFEKSIYEMSHNEKEVFFEYLKKNYEPGYSYYLSSDSIKVQKALLDDEEILEAFRNLINKLSYSNHINNVCTHVYDSFRMTNDVKTYDKTGMRSKNNSFNSRLSEDYETCMNTLIKLAEKKAETIGRPAYFDIKKDMESYKQLFEIYVQQREVKLFKNMDRQDQKKLIAAKNFIYYDIEKGLNETLKVTEDMLEDENLLRRLIEIADQIAFASYLSVQNNKIYDYFNENGKREEYDGMKTENGENLRSSNNLCISDLDKEIYAKTGEIAKELLSLQQKLSLKGKGTKKGLNSV